jgi:5-formyltetrahydrofolate cyclo-ligase
MRKRRGALPPADAQRAAQQAAALLANDPRWDSLHNIALYLPNDREVDTAPIAARAQHAGHRLFLPRLTGDCLEFAPWSGDSALKTNRFGIGEPTTAAVDARALDLIVLPLVAVGRDGMRLGMGGGFYDRTLSNLVHAVPAVTGTGPLLLGLAYAFQCVEAVPAEPWDIPVHAVLTESELRMVD